MMDLSVDLSDIAAAEEDAKIRHFFTSLEHLDVHFGIRRGVYSVMMGTPSCGKSGLAKLYGIQASTTPHARVLYWLSEESKAKYAIGMDKYCEATGADLSKVSFFEEKKIDKAHIRSHSQFLMYFREVVCSVGADLVIIDNITSSRFYGPSTSLKEQGQTVEFFKEFTNDADIGLVAVMHTSSDVSDNMGRLFTTEDVRGLKSISIEAAYFYALQKFTRNGDIYTFLRTLKHRFHQQGSGTYLLKYDPTYSMYTGDARVPFEKVKQIFKESDRLK
jgi:hypothetical protein